MSFRLFNNATLTVEREVVELFAEVAIGTTGAPTLTRGKGIASIARNAAGDYTVTLQDRYVRLLFAEASIMRATAIEVNMQLISEAVATDKTVRFQGTEIQTTPALVELTDGDVLYIHLKLMNSAD